MVRGAHKPSAGDALAYLNTVKHKFRYQREKYDKFLEVLTDYFYRRVDFLGVIKRIKELFKGYQELVVGFNNFMPNGLVMTLEPEDEEHPPKKSVCFEDALNFVTKVKRRFQDDNRPYRSFVHILNRYRMERKSATEVYHEVSILFWDHKDLLAEFTDFLPADRSESVGSNSVSSSSSS